MPLRAAYTAAAAPAGPPADDQHVVRVLGIQLRGIARRAAGVELRDDFLDIHPALAEVLAVQEDHRHGQHLALSHFLLVQPAVDHDALDARVQHRHQVQRLHHVRAVVAGQRHVGLETEVSVEGLDLFDEFGFDLRRVAAHLQQREHERGEFMAHRDRREANPRRFSNAAEGERRPA
jgi:hypothetical protein